MRRQPRSRIHGGDVTLWNMTSDEENVNEHEEAELTSALEGVPFRKHFFYVGTPKRIQEITEEERFLQKDEVQVPPVMQLDRILKSENMRSFNPAALPRNSFLTQPDNYSRHRGLTD